MRNLKRVLSLALASAMLIGMMVVGAAASKTAADLTDSAKITNKEAVTLLVDLGIIEGKPDGSYAPAETVNRATMAKLITVMMMGDVDQTLFKGTSTDLKDINGHWAEGYIKYCYSNGYIAGDGAGHFMPDAPVTTVAAAKMLLVAIGYNAKDRGYENNANWSVNIMKDAQTTNVYGATTVRPLTKGLSLKATDSLSRDNAAQMIFNTLFVATKSPSYQWDGGKQYIQSYSNQPALATTAYNGLTEASGILKNVKLVNKVATATINSTDYALSASPSDIGLKVVYYVDANTNLVSTAAIANGSAKVLASRSAGTVYADLVDSTNANKKYISATPDGTVNYILNGKYEDTTGAATKGAVSAGSVGTLVEFIDTDNNGKYDVVKVTTYTLSKVSSVAAAKGDNEATVTIAGLGSVTNLTSSANVVPVSKIEGATDLEKDDIILYNIVGDTSTANSVAKIVVAHPETVEGKVNSKANDFKEVTVGSTKYTASAVSAANAGLDATVTAVTIGSTMIAYLDASGNVIGFNTVAEAATNYAYALVTKFDAASYANNYKATLSGLFLLADGTQSRFVVKSVDGKDPAGDSDNTTQGYLAAGLVKYRVNSDGEMVVTRVAADATNTANIAKGAATITVGSETAYATDKTVYFFHSGTVGTTGHKTTVFVGRANAPAYNGANVSLYKDGTSAVAVVINAAAPVSGTGEYAYLLKDNSYLEVEDGKLYSVVIGGTKTTLLLESGTFTTGDAGAFYTVATKSDGTKVFANTTAYTANVYAGTVNFLTSDIIVVNSNEYKLASSYNVYVDDSTPADSALTKGDTVKVLFSSANGVNTVTDVVITADT